MLIAKNRHLSISMRVTLVWIFLVAIPTLRAQDFYVNAETGNNFNAGTQSSPWKTVDFALNGPHAPLPNKATIHLYNTNVPYSIASGESFPWVLYNNISIVAESGGSGPDHIVDAVGSGQSIISYNPNHHFHGCSIDGITFMNGDIAIEAAPNGTYFVVTIRDCTFKSMATKSIDIVGNSNAVTAPSILNNRMEETSADYSVHILLNAGFTGVRIEGNDITGGTGREAIHVEGTPATGKTIVNGNTLDGKFSHWGWDGAITFDGYVGTLECTDNVIRGSSVSQIYIRGSNPWSKKSLVESNQCIGTSLNVGINIDGTAGVTLRANECSGSGIGVRLTGGCDDAVIEKNKIYSNNKGFECIWGSNDVVIADNEISGNSGWGLEVVGSNNMLISQNAILGNTSGGISLSATDTRIVRNLITGNGGSGIRDARCQGTVIASNFVVANGGIGIELTASSPSLKPEIVNNTCAANSGFGFWSSLASTTPAYVASCIFWGNNQGGGDIAGVSYGQYWNCDIGVGGSPGNGNISQDPLFKGPGDYGLQAGSPCIDAGLNPTVAWTTDYDGHPRILDSLWTGSIVTDMGADEVGDTSLSVTGSYQPGTPLTVEISAAGQGGAPFQLWIAADRFAMPLAAPPGLKLKLYGTLLIEPTKIVYGGPVLTGTLSPLGLFVDSSSLSVPMSPALVGLNLAFQAFIGDPGYGAGQGTPAATFMIGQ